MRRALALAKRGTGGTYPNPCVGAVVVNNGKRVGQAHSGPAGQAHAEVRALRKAGEAAKGADLYVTLEPCCHTGRTPPCTKAIEAAGIRRVFVCVIDPSPKMSGKGVRKLRRAGIEVDVGLLQREGTEVHAHYLHHVNTGRPWVTLKVAMSVDGRIATAGGNSQWISGEPARKHAHALRARHHAIAVGATTAMVDDPRLNVRLVRGSDPWPVVFDTRLRAFEAKRRPRILRPGTLVVHTRNASADARAKATAAGVELVCARSQAGHVHLGDALDRLGEREIRSLMVEGGGRLLGALVRQGLAQELHVVRAPLLLGEGRAAFAGMDFGRVEQAPRLRECAQRRLGDDLLTIYRFAPTR